MNCLFLLNHCSFCEIQANFLEPSYNYWRQKILETNLSVSIPQNQKLLWQILNNTLPHFHDTETSAQQYFKYFKTCKVTDLPDFHLFLPHWGFVTIFWNSPQPRKFFYYYHNNNNNNNNNNNKNNDNNNSNNNTHLR